MIDQPQPNMAEQTCLDLTLGLWYLDMSVLVYQAMGSYALQTHLTCLTYQTSFNHAQHLMTHTCIHSRAVVQSIEPGRQMRQDNRFQA